MPKKKKTIAKPKASAAKPRSRASSSRVSGKSVSQSFGRFGMPLLICVVLIAGLAVMGVFGYRTVTESDFFKVRSINIRGNEKTPSEDIRRIVAADVEKPGVWNADLADIKLKIEKFPYVKSASVSRMLPAGIRVDVTERVPAAIVRLKGGEFLVDGEGAILSTAAGNQKDFPIVVNGWDESKTERAPTDNVARLKLYKKMLDEWKQFDLLSRVTQVDLSDLREPTAIVEDSGRAISIMLAKDSLGKSLKTAIEAVAGKGAKIKSVNAGSGYPVIQYLDF